MILPYEIANLISFSLSPRDKYECILVCQAWFTAFLPSVYQHVNLCRDSMIAHRRILHDSTEMGRCVQKLIVDDGILSLNDMKQLNKKCPNLSTLHFRWCIQSSAPSSSPSPTMDNYFYHSPAPLFFAIDGTRLSHLSLKCHEPPSWTGYTLLPLPIDNGDVQAFFKHTPKLESLSLNGFFPKLQIEHLDMIHACCPELIELELVSTMTSSSIECNEELIQQRLRLSGHHHYPRLLQQSQHEVNNLNRHDTLPKIRHFRLKYPEGWQSLSTWLEYFLVRYTHLSTLALQNTGPLPAQCHPTVLLFAHTGFELPATLNKVSFMNLSATNIQRLHPPLAHLRHLTDVCIRGQDIHYFFSFSGLITNIRFAIQRLWIPLPVHATVGQYEQLNYCYHLTDLTLEMNQQETARLDFIFQNCRQLKSLTLIRARLNPEMIQSIPVSLYFDRCDANHHLIQLEKFGLENTIIEQGEQTLNQLLRHVLRSVVDLCIVDCSFQHIEKRGLTLFHLPERRFRSLNITNARICFSDLVKRIPGILNHSVTLFKCRQLQHFSLKNDVMTNQNKKRERPSNTIVAQQKLQWWEAPIYSNAYRIHRLDPEFTYQRPSIIQVNNLDSHKMEQVTKDPYDCRYLVGNYKRYARMITLSGYMTFHCASIEILRLNRHTIR